jgi:hypothetical protein
MSIAVSRTATQPKPTFDVEVREGRGSSRHTVTMDDATFTRLAGASGATAEELVHAVFEFLLEREPKESILSRFELGVISRYFPEFESELPRYLSG